jgi:hypothetical protein
MTDLLTDKQGGRQLSAGERGSRHNERRKFKPHPSTFPFPNFKNKIN